MYGRFVGFRAALRILYNHYDDMSVVESREQARFIRKWLEDIRTSFEELVPLLEQRGKADWLLTKLAAYAAT